MNDSVTQSPPSKVLVVDDIAANRNLLREMLEGQGYEVLLAPDGETALKAAHRALPDTILLDVLMPGLDGFQTCRKLKQIEALQTVPVIFITAKEEVSARVEGFRAGGVDYITKPFQAEEVLMRIKTHLDNARLTRALTENNRQLEQTNERLRQEIARREQAEASLQTVDAQLTLLSEMETERWGISGFIGRSRTMAAILDSVRKCQGISSINVLITGESGTGKELVARAVHFGSARARGPFVPVNCTAIPAELAESCLFGHVKGAFTGAVADRKGYFELAQGGTLFLDEIGDMPLALQGKLLRVLEENEVIPLGSIQPRKTETHIVAATNADIQNRIRKGQFRQDLYFRLARFIIDVPPLRERSEDILALAEHFARHFAEEMRIPAPELTPDATVALEAYDFPGNIRELKNLIERALIETGGAPIEPEHLHFLSIKQETDSGEGMLALSAGYSSGQDEQRILEYVRRHQTINNTQCRDLLGVGLQRACYLLRKLHAGGELERDHTGRWTQSRKPSAR
jgi:DNA-binding NtrC family response regulator